jgi:hypothetical protein
MEGRHFFCVFIIHRSEFSVTGMNINDNFPTGLNFKLESSKSSLRKALENLPINTLAIIAAELGVVLGSPEARPDLPEDAQQAIDDLQLDVMNAGSIKLSGFDDFLVIVNAWYLSRDSGWYQNFLDDRQQHAKL